MTHISNLVSKLAVVMIDKCFHRLIETAKRSEICSQDYGRLSIIVLRCTPDTKLHLLKTMTVCVDKINQSTKAALFRK